MMGGIIVKNITCIICPKGCDISVEMVDEVYKISGNKCARGKEYALNEMTRPMRSICSTVKTIYKEFPRLPVRTDKEIDVINIFPVMKEINKVEINHPVHAGEIVVSNILNTGVNIIATSDMYDLLEVVHL
jgi:CxxC motif-containing protein